MNHASIVPLIGGETLASEEAFGTKPKYILSYEAFQANDSHIVNWYGGSVPYHVLDKGDKPNGKVDVVSSVCPCAGLSMLSQGYGDHNPANDWMPKVAEYVLGDMRPKVYWGENSPHFAGKIGVNVRNNLRQIGLKHGYVMSVYRTKSLLHGLPQVRERSFYFFWKGDKIPLLEYFNRPYVPIEKFIGDIRSNSQMEPINPKTPSVDDPYYKFILQHIHGGVTHREFATNIIKPATARGADSLAYIEAAGFTYQQVGEWMGRNGFPKEVAKCEHRAAKIADGKSIMRRSTIVPRDYIGAFVGQYPTMLTHPTEDRYITYREGMSIMGLPTNFELLNPKRSANHICQNVPVPTARDMAAEVRESLLGNRDFVSAKYLLQSNHSKKHVVETESKTLEELIA